MAGLVSCKSSLLFLPVCPHARPAGAVCSLVRLFLRSAWASAVAFLWFSLAVPSGCRFGVSRLPALTGRGKLRFTRSSFRFRLPRSGVTRAASGLPGRRLRVCGAAADTGATLRFSLRRFGRVLYPFPAFRLLSRLAGYPSRYLRPLCCSRFRCPPPACPVSVLRLPSSGFVGRCPRFFKEPLSPRPVSTPAPAPPPVCPLSRPSIFIIAHCLLFVNCFNLKYLTIGV